MQKPVNLNIVIMKNLMNSVTLLGNVGMTPAVKTFGNGKKMAILNLATGERKKDEEGRYTKAAFWHKLVVWGKTAELVEHYVGKGQRLYVEGRLVQQTKKTKTGDTRKDVRIQVSRIHFVNKKTKTEEITDALPF
jgi:single-strand DNA-binding protein